MPAILNSCLPTIFWSAMTTGRWMAVKLRTKRRVLAFVARYASRCGIRRVARSIESFAGSTSCCAFAGKAENVCIALAMRYLCMSVNGQLQSSGNLPQIQSTTSIHSAPLCPEFLYLARDLTKEVFPDSIIAAQCNDLIY